MSIPYTERCDRCGKTYGDHCGNECPDEKGSFTMLNTTEQEAKLWQELSRYLKEAKEQSIINRNQCEAYRVEYESRAIWIEDMNKILGYDNSDGHHSRPDPFEIAASLKARAEGFERLAAECDALKESNAELRKQLSANTETISKLHHNVRLVQETHSQQVRECAEKAAQGITRQYTIPLNFRHDATPLFVQIICEAFSVPAKDECDKAFHAEWATNAAYRGMSSDDKQLAQLAFRAAWKLAKGGK